MVIDDFMAYAREHWERIRAVLLAGSYQPMPVKGVEIPEATGGTRRDSKWALFAARYWNKAATY